MKKAILLSVLTLMAGLAFLHCNGIDYNEKIFLKHPEWLREAEKERGEVNVWTVDGEENLRRHSTTKGIDIITTNDPTILSGILSPNK